jgi:uncharacterized protein YjiS (DUF1127 family)
MATMHITSATHASPFARIAAMFAAGAARYKKYRMYRETFDGLSALSNRDLADLGIGRSDIRRIAIEAVER